MDWFQNGRNEEPKKCHFALRSIDEDRLRSDVKHDSGFDLLFKLAIVIDSFPKLTHAIVGWSMDQLVFGLDRILQRTIHHCVNKKCVYYVLTRFQVLYKSFVHISIVILVFSKQRGIIQLTHYRNNSRIARGVCDKVLPSVEDLERFHLFWHSPFWSKATVKLTQFSQHVGAWSPTRSD